MLRLGMLALNGALAGLVFGVVDLGESVWRWQHLAIVGLFAVSVACFVGGCVRWRSAPVTQTARPADPIAAGSRADQARVDVTASVSER